MDDVRKIDTSNIPQVELMHRYLSHNMAVVDFWLTYCVLPTETGQYPQRLSANSWHLADGGHVVGFSGTNDNHRLLPLQVHQADLGEQHQLSATNGKMLDMMMSLAGYSTLQPQVGGVLGCGGAGCGGALCRVGRMRVGSPVVCAVGLDVGRLQ